MDSDEIPIVLENIKPQKRKERKGILTTETQRAQRKHLEKMWQLKGPHHVRLRYNTN